MNNLHRLTSSRFQHEKVGLCGCCAHRLAFGEWQGFCSARRVILSYNAKPAKKPRCPDYVSTTTANS